jgi:acyl carrier protein
MDLTRRVSELLGIPPDRLEAENNPPWDSLTQLELMVTLERIYGVRFSTRDIQAAKSLQSIRESLARRGVDP